MAGNEDRVKLLVPVMLGSAFFLGIELGGFNLALLPVARSFGLNAAVMGFLVTLQYVTVTLAPMVFGWVADRIGKKPMFLIFMPVFTAGCFLTAAAESVFVFVAGILILGAGYSVCESVGSSTLSDSFPGRENVYMNLMQCAFSLGAVTSPLFFRWFLDKFGFSWPLIFIVPGCGFVLLYPLMLFAGCRKAGDPGTGGRPGEAKTKGLKPLLPILGSPFFLALLFSMLAYVAIETGTSYFIDSLLVMEYQNTVLGAWAISGFWFAMTVSRFFFASIKMRPRLMILLGYAASAAVLLLLFLVKNQWIFLGAVIVQGFMMGPVWPMVLSTGMSAFQEKSGALGGILYAGGGFGGMVTPVLFGVIAEACGFYAGFLLLAFIAAAGFIVMKIWGEKKTA
ncbi:MAG: MFS transporter [Treponema sp.]|jgi:MFS family permease|nr:MFS transporter [Treponema sp.]